MQTRLIVIISLLSTIILHKPSFAQQQAGRLSRVPADSMVMGSIDVKAIRNHPEFGLLPWEIFSVASKEQLGCDFTVIQTVDIAAGLPMAGPDFAAVITTDSPVDISELKIPDLGEIQTNKQNLKYRQLGNPPIRIAQADSIVYAGIGPSLNKVISGSATTSRALELAKEATEPIVLVVAIEKIRPILADLLRNPTTSAQIPPRFLQPLTDLVKNTQALRLTSSVGSQAVSKLDFVATDAAAAKNIDQALGQLRDAGFALIDEQLAEAMNQSDVSDGMKTAISTYAGRIQQAVRQGVWNQDGDRVHFEMAFNSTTNIGIITGLVLPAIQSARQAARRMASSNNLRQLTLAFHNHEAAYGELPRRVITSEDGTPLLSWRVAILPFIDQQALYDKFRLDEPWDSPHNKALIEKMPAVFASPLATRISGHSNYVFPFGLGLPGDEQQLKFVNIADGASNTIALLEVNEAYAVPWTAPEDLDVDEYDITDAFATELGTNASFFDGAIRFISQEVDPEILKALLTHAGGEVIGKF